MPPLATERLVLRPFTLDDVPAVFALSREAGMRHIASGRKAS